MHNSSWFKIHFHCYYGAKSLYLAPRYSANKFLACASLRACKDMLTFKGFHFCPKYFSVSLLLGKVDGNWSEFDDGVCSVTCGKGTVTRTRKCNNPAPYYGGKDCVGSDTKTEYCERPACPGKRWNQLWPYTNHYQTQSNFLQIISGPVLKDSAISLASIASQKSVTCTH